MFRYEIPCNDLDRALAAIDRSVSSNLQPYFAGIHFKKRDDMRIRGFELRENEWDCTGGRGGFPLTVEFRGQFICKENGQMVLDVWLYPALWQVWLFPVALWGVLYHINPIGICIWTSASIFMMKCYSDLIDKTVAELKRITGAFWCDEP